MKGKQLRRSQNGSPAYMTKPAGAFGPGLENTPIAYEAEKSVRGGIQVFARDALPSVQGRSEKVLREIGPGWKKQKARVPAAVCGREGAFLPGEHKASAKKGKPRRLYGFVL